MKWFYNLKIRAKLLISFAVVAAIAGVVGVVGVVNIRQIERADTLLYQENTVPISQLGEIGVLFQRYRINVRDYVLAETPEAARKAAATCRTISEKIGKLASSYEKTISTSQGRKLFEAFGETRKDYIAVSQELMALASAGKKSQAQEIMRGAGYRAARAEQSAIQDMVNINVKQARERSESNSSMARRAVATMTVFIVIAVAMAIGLGIFIAKVLGAPVQQLSSAADKLALGDMDVSIDASGKDEIGDLSRSMQAMVENIQDQAKAADRIAQGDLSVDIKAASDKDVLAKSMTAVVEALRGLMAEAGMLSKAAVEGQLETRGNADRFEGGFKQIVQGVNDTLDAVIGPLNVAAEYVERISNGDIPERITDNYNGDFNEIKNNLNRCIDTLNGLMNEMAHMAREHDAGDIDVAIDADKFQGAYKAVAEGINNMVGGHIAVKKKAMACVAEFGRGNFDAELERFPGKKAFINDTIEQVRTNLKMLIAEMDKMSREHDAGDIDVFIDGSKFEGSYRAVAEGINAMVAGHIAVKKKAMACIAEFGKGNFEAELEKFPGKKAFINETIEQVRHNLRALIADTDELVAAALAGMLDTRADATKHEGDFRKIVEGVNRTLDAVIDPVNEAAEVLDRLAHNDLTARVVGDYKGDHAKIKDSLNKAMETLQEALRQVSDATTKVTASSETLTATSEEVGKASQQIAETSSQVAAGSQEQSKTVQDSSAAMEQLSRAIDEVAKGTQAQAKTVDETVALVQQITAAIDQVANSAQNAAQTSQQVKEVATEGGQQVADAVGSMDRIKEATDRVGEMVKQLGESSQQIGAIVETIDDIAEQTNLLALNAAIEAARAGEHGKGFAVVADEVRKLAERSSKATGEIAELIGGIRQMTDHAVEAMDQSSKEVSDGTALGNQAGEALSRIQEAVASVVSQAQEVASAAQQMSSSSSEVIKAIENVSAITEQSTAATEEMAASSGEVTRQIEQVAAVSEQNAAAAQEVSATTQEQNAAAEEMSAASEELATMAKQLQEMLSQFKMTEDGQVHLTADSGSLSDFAAGTASGKRRKAA